MLMILASTKFVFLLSLSHYFGCYGNLKFTFDFYDEKRKIAISVISLELFEFCIYVNVC